MKELTEQEYEAIKSRIRLRLVLDKANPPSTTQEGLERAAKLVEQALQEGFNFLKPEDRVMVIEEHVDHKADEGTDR